MRCKPPVHNQAFDSEIRLLKKTYDVLNCFAVGYAARAGKPCDGAAVLSIDRPHITDDLSVTKRFGVSQFRHVAVFHSAVIVGPIDAKPNVCHTVVYASLKPQLPKIINFRIVLVIKEL